MAAIPTTPGVYIQEVSSFPNAVAAVPTAIPAFVGYTSRADYNGKSFLLKPVSVASMNDFLTYFGAVDPTGQPLPESAQYVPIYYPVTAAGGPGSPPDVTLSDGSQWDILPDAGSIYYLYNSMRLFFQNGGGQCYVVSAGFYGTPAGKPFTAGPPLINTNVTFADLSNGLTALETEPEPTMIVIPDSVLLAEANYGNLLVNILQQCFDMMSRVGILDVYNGDAATPLGYQTDITSFKNDVGMENLSYGAAYYPFLQTTIEQDAGINFVNLGGAKALTTVLPGATSDPLKTLLGQIPSATPGSTSALQTEKGLLTNADYTALHDAVLEKINILPPSGAMAGIYTMVDNSVGVWKAPANVSVVGATDVTLAFTDTTQGPLNVDPITGKSINVIRKFPGFGVLVWGARTLDGNDLNYQYISVRRTLIFIEQSIKAAARTYVFMPNVPATWSFINSMLTSFLTGLWTQGALAGSSAATSFAVSVGLGTTMTADDILNGILNISVSVAVSHPAEFIVISVSQQLQS